MSDPNTLRVLSLDGGGERGYLSLNFFQKFIQLWGISPSAIAQNFDVITGNSIGGIMALAFALGYTPDTISNILTTQGPYIFSLSSIIPSLRPNQAAKIALALTDTPFYQSSGPTAPYYGFGLLTATLQSYFGSNTLQNLQTNVIIPSYQKDTSTYVLFSNLNYPDYIGQNELISNVALATSAAPFYFPSLSLNGHTYIDGAVYQNNPAEFGRTLAQIIKPTANRCCVLSIGTGIGELGFDPGLPDIVDPRVESFLKNNKAIPIVDELVELIGIATTGGQESVAKNLYLESTYSLTQLYYYRFQPILDPNINTELDNTDPEILTYYEDTATDYFNEDIENIATFLGHLTA
jgi:hypothetical protein